MIQPPWFINPFFPNHVFHLNKALYGLKQSLRPWFQKLILALLQFSFQLSWADTSLFMYHIAMDTVMAMVYIDDILVNSSSSTPIAELISYLHNSFVICYLGEISYFLAIPVHRNGVGMYLNQSVLRIFSYVLTYKTQNLLLLNGLQVAPYLKQMVFPSLIPMSA